MLSQKRRSINTGELRWREIHNLFETALRQSVPTLPNRVLPIFPEKALDFP